MDRDRELETIRRAQAGDEAAWRELLQYHRGAIYAWARRGQRSGRDLNDCLSVGNEALVRCVRAFDPARGFRLVTLLWTSLRNAILRSLRVGPIGIPHYRRERPPASGEIDRSIAAPDQSIDLELDLAEAIEQLPERWAEVVRLRLAGATFKEISESIGASSQRALQIQQQAAGRLRELLQAYCQPPS